MNEYDDAQARLERFLQRDHAGIGEAGRSLVLDHGRRTGRAFLLLHGLSASPGQFAGIAARLHQRGHNVFVPRLPRHGYGDRLTDVLATMNLRQLRACAADSLQIARGLGERVTVAGFSLGATMAAEIGQRERVHRAVLISPFLGVAFVPRRMRVWMAQWVLHRRNRFYWWDPILRERQLPAHGYPRFSTHAIGHGLSLASSVIDEARHREPAAEELVIVLNERDPAVHRRAILDLAQAWASHARGRVRLHRLRGIPRVHDIVEPKRYPDVVERLEPVLVDAIDGTREE